MIIIKEHLNHIYRADVLKVLFCYIRYIKLLGVKRGSNIINLLFEILNSDLQYSIMIIERGGVRGTSFYIKF